MKCDKKDLLLYVIQTAKKAGFHTVDIYDWYI